MNNILFTGGSGTLGRALIPLLEGRVSFPDSKSMNLLNKKQIRHFIQSTCPNTIIHSAAYTDVIKAQKDKDICWNTNVNGTLNLVNCIGEGTKVIYISSDYVFDGIKGDYSEEDIPNPLNFYSKTKVIGENIIKTCDDFLIIRTSFCKDRWGYNSAFSDVCTTQDYVGTISRILAQIINNIEEIKPNSILHVGTNKKSMYELAFKTNPAVKPISYKESKVPVPKNTDLNIAKQKILLERIIQNSRGSKAV